MNIPAGSSVLSIWIILSLIFLGMNLCSLHAEPNLAPHLSLPFGDSRKTGYHDRLPWAVPASSNSRWGEKIKELENFRRKAFIKGAHELTQFGLFQKQRIQRVRNSNQRVEALIGTVNRKIPEWAFQN
jgi:hypothetical protein